MAEGGSLDRELRTVLARRAVEQVEPDELPLFPAIHEEFERDPARALRGGRTRDETLGFGVDVVVPLLTPVALAVAGEVVKRAGQYLGQSGRRWLLAALGRAAHSDALPAAARWSPAELAEIGRVARERGTELRLSESRASALADAIVATLATTVEPAGR